MIITYSCNALLRTVTQYLVLLPELARRTADTQHLTVISFFNLHQFEGICPRIIHFPAIICSSSEHVALYKFYWDNDGMLKRRDENIYETKN